MAKKETAKSSGQKEKTPGQKLRDQLEEVHPDYEKYLARWQMLADLWDGTGGVASPYDRIVADDGEQLGEAFEPLPGWKGTTYLDRYPRESRKHFLGRIRTAHYENHLRDIGETILGYLDGKPPEIKGLPSWLEKWTKTAGPRRRSLDAVRKTIRMNMLRFGCCPVLVDRSASRARNQLEAKALGLRTYVLPYAPQSLRGWNLLDDGWEWVLLKDMIVRWVNPDEPPQKVERWVRWTRADWIRWEAVNDGDPEQVAGDLHTLKRVPLVLFQFSEPTTDSPLPAPPLMGVAETGRRRYNVQSEQTDVLRGFGMPIFCYPTVKGRDIKGLKAGSDAAIPYPDTGNAPLLLTLDAAVLAGYADQANNLTAAEYRQARADFGTGDSGTAESGYAKAQRFQRNNTQYVQFGNNEAEGLRDLFDCVARWERKAPERELAKLEITPETNYNLRDIDQELAQGEQAARIDFCPTAMAKLKKQLRNLLVKLEGKELKDSDDEIDAEAAAKRGMVPPSGQGDVPFGAAGGPPPTRVPEEDGEAQQREEERAAAE